MEFDCVLFKLSCVLTSSRCLLLTVQWGFLGTTAYQYCADYSRLKTVFYIRDSFWLKSCMVLLYRDFVAITDPQLCPWKHCWRVTKKKSLRKTYSTHVPAAELQLNNAFSTASTEFSGWNIKWNISRDYFLLQKHFKKTTATCINDFNEHWNVCSDNSQHECERQKHNIAPHSSGPVVNNNLSAGCIPV